VFGTFLIEAFANNQSFVRYPFDSDEYAADRYKRK